MSVEEEMEITTFDQIIALTGEYYDTCMTAQMGPELALGMSMEFHRVLLGDFMAANRVDD